MRATLGLHCNRSFTGTEHPEFSGCCWIIHAARWHLSRAKGASDTTKKMYQPSALTFGAVQRDQRGLGFSVVFDPGKLSRK